MALHAGCSQSICTGVCGVTGMGASSGQMSVIPEGTAVFGTGYYPDNWSYGCWYANAAGLLDL